MPEIEDLSGRKLGELVLRARIGEGGFEAEIARWRLPVLPSTADLARDVDRFLPCLPVRFDEASGSLVDQVQHCGFP